MMYYEFWMQCFKFLDPELPELLGKLYLLPETPRIVMKTNVPFVSVCICEVSDSIVLPLHKVSACIDSKNPRFQVGIFLENLGVLKGIGSIFEVLNALLVIFNPTTFTCFLQILNFSLILPAGRM